MFRSRLCVDVDGVPPGVGDGGPVAAGSRAAEPDTTQRWSPLPPQCLPRPPQVRHRLAAFLELDAACLQLSGQSTHNQPRQCPLREDGAVLGREQVGAWLAYGPVRGGWHWLISFRLSALVSHAVFSAL